MTKIVLLVTLHSAIFSQISYLGQIQPILNSNCTGCHMGGGAATLDLTNYNGVMAGGVSGLSVISGDHQNSELYNRITLPEGAAGSMPPNDPLSPEEINLIAEWINEGASNLSSENYILPQNFILNQNYPNPFNPNTTITYTLPDNQMTTLKIFDASGRIIRTMVHKFQYSGLNEVKWDALNDDGQKASAGVYFYSIETENIRQTKKMILLK